MLAVIFQATSLADLVCGRDWMGKYKGKSTLALRPRTTQQVSQILAHCNKRRLAVVPQVRSAPP